MRIAIDARELHGRPTGVGRYLGEILRSWNELPAARTHDIVLCSPEPLTLPGLDRLRLSTLTGAGRGTRWEQLTLPGLLRRAGADVLFAPGYTGPLRCPVPMVVAVHDVSYAAHPEWFRWREGLRRRVLTWLSGRRAAAVLTISEFSRREIETHLGIDSRRIRVIYPGVTALPPQGDGERATGLVLYVGSIFHRRHLPELIEGFARVARTDAAARLEIVGDNRTNPPLDLERIAASHGMMDRVSVRQYVSDSELAFLYARATAFAFLSDYEGFGLTPLEALSAGIPIVVLDTPVAREIYRDAAIYVDRPDPAAIEAALRRALGGVEERARLLSAARGVLARYSWTDCGARVLDVLVAAGAGATGSHR